MPTEPPVQSADVGSHEAYPVRFSALPWVAVGIALLVQLPGFAFVGDAAGTPIFLALAFVSSFLLLGMRRFSRPVVVLLAVLGAPALSFGQGVPFSVAPLAIAVVAAVLDQHRVWVWATIAGLALVGPLMVIVERPVAVHLGLPVSVSRPLAVVLGLSILVGIAEIYRARRDHATESARQHVLRRRSQAEAERLRIARELHDVLAHALSQISVQAGVGLQLFDSRPERARQALDSVKSTSAQALEELRGVLGFLREAGDEPRRSAGPDVSRLPGLFASFRDSGLSIEDDLEVDDLGTAAQHAVYRIVQEALTNVARHADASWAGVQLMREPDGYVLRILDGGTHAPTEVTEGSGMLGMRERAALLEGVMHTERTSSGGFCVEVRWPATQPVGDLQTR